MQRILPENLVPGREYRILVQYYATHPIPPTIIRVGTFVRMEELSGERFARFSNVNSENFGLQSNPLFNINDYHFYQPTEHVMYDELMRKKGLPDLVGSYWTKPKGGTRKKQRKIKRNRKTK